MNTTTIMKLPTEILSKVISYLGTDDKLRLSEVCRKFREVTFLPSMWRIVEITIQSLEELSDFCTLYTAHPHLKKLSLSFFLGRQVLTKQETHSLNELFRKSESLIWLHLHIIDLEHIILPANLKHLKYVYASNSVDLNAQISSIDKCLFLEHLHLVDITSVNMTPSKFVSFKEAFGTLLFNRKESLQSLYLSIGPMPEDWINLISNCCKKLKLFGVTTKPLPEAPGIRVNYISNFSKLPNLEIIFLESRIDFTNTEDCMALPNVKHLFLKSVNRNFGRNDYMFILKTFPNLETIFLARAIREGALDFIVKSKSLKHIGIGNMLGFNLEKLIELQKERQYSSICLCDNYRLLNPQSPIDEVIKATFPKEKCFFHFLNPFQDLIWDESKAFSNDYLNYWNVSLIFAKLKELFLF